jgi:hypothetical protein
MAVDAYVHTSTVIVYGVCLIINNRWYTQTLHSMSRQALESLILCDLDPDAHASQPPTALVVNCTPRNFVQGVLKICPDVHAMTASNSP